MLGLLLFDNMLKLLVFLVIDLNRRLVDATINLVGVTLVLLCKMHHVHPGRTLDFNLLIGFFNLACVDWFEHPLDLRFGGLHVDNGELGAELFCELVDALLHINFALLELRWLFLHLANGEGETCLPPVTSHT
jgi:hypothetical protein